MNPRRPNPFIAWFCLIWFGLTSTVLAGGLVVCRDGRGDSRIEWGCGKTESGECLNSCAEEPSDDPAHPCHDTPIASDAQATQAPPRSIDAGGVAQPEWSVASLSWPADLQSKQGLLCTTPEPERPPDTLRCIRTIVLLV